MISKTKPERPCEIRKYRIPVDGINRVVSRERTDGSRMWPENIESSSASEQFRRFK